MADQNVMTCLRTIFKHESQTVGNSSLSDIKLNLPTSVPPSFYPLPTRKNDFEMCFYYITEVELLQVGLFKELEG